MSDAVMFWDMVPDCQMPDFPRRGGAYILVIHLEKTVTLSGKRFAGVTLSGGYYLYCGSAFGSGGIGARVRRHCAAEKKYHWHIDALSTAPAGRVVAVASFEGGSECDLVAALHQSDVCVQDFPVPGFGSSDCRNCVSHLLAVGNYSDQSEIVSKLRDIFS